MEPMSGAQVTKLQRITRRPLMNWEIDESAFVRFAYHAFDGGAPPPFPAWDKSDLATNPTGLPTTEAL